MFSSTTPHTLYDFKRPQGGTSIPSSIRTLLDSLRHNCPPPTELQYRSLSDAARITAFHYRRHVGTKGSYEVLPSRIRSLEDHPYAKASTPHWPEAYDRSPHGTLQYEMHILRRIYLQRPQIQRSERDYGGEVPDDLNFPLLYSVYAMLVRDYLQDRPKEHGLHV